MSATPRAEGFLIRGAYPSDAERLTEIARSAKASWGYPAEWLAAWEDELSFTPEFIAESPVFVAENAAGVVGVVAFVVEGDRASLEHFWIDPAEQRQGIGRALFEGALKDAAEQGCRLVEVVSDPYALAFYERLGGRRVVDEPAAMPGAPERMLPVLHFRL